MAQQLGNPQTGTEGTHAAVDGFLIGPSSVAVAQAVVGHGTGRILILNLGPHFIDVLLESGNGNISRHAVRDKQLVPPRRDGQQLFQFNGNTFIDGHGADLAALPFNGNSVFPERPFRSGRVNAETLMDAQSGVPGQAGDGGEVLVAVHHTGCQKSVELPDAPGAVHPAEAPALQLHRQFVVGGQAVFCPLNLVVKEADGRQVGLDGGGGFLPLLHIENVGSQVLAVDVGQLLQTIFLRKKFAEPLHGLVVPLLGAETTLAVVPGGLVQLSDESLIDTRISRFYCYSIAPYFYR